MMGKLNAVPLSRCRGPWRERKQRTVPTSRDERDRGFLSVIAARDTEVSRGAETTGRCMGPGMIPTEEIYNPNV